MLATIALLGLNGCQATRPEKPSERILAYVPYNGDPVLPHVRELLSDRQVGITGYPVPANKPLANQAEINIARRNALLANYSVREESGRYRCASTASGSCLKPPDAQVSLDRTPAPFGSTRSWPTGLPRACVALSGGGTRSAAFSIGVMQSLAESGLLDRVDVISGVSGGSYALAWYLTSKINAEARAGRRLLAREVLAEDGVAVRSILQTPGLISTPYGVLAVGTNVMNQAMKVLFGEDNAANNPYWAALHATFLSGACADCVVDGRFLMKDLAPLLSLDGLPFPVIGMSARTRAQGKCDPPGTPRTSLEQSYFEVTPLRQGSLNFYTDGGMGLALADAVALSGAAVSVPSAQYCAIADAAGQSLGTWWRYSSASHVPRDAPVGGADAPWIESQETERFLADGGHVENLGIFPLVQRLCQSILVIDAEHDPNLVFEGLEVLGSHLEQRGIHWVQPLVNSAGQTPDSLRDTHRYVADTVKDPVFTGRLGTIPFYHATESDTGSDLALSRLGIDVHYIKLSINGASVDLDGCDTYRAQGRLDLARYCNERRESETSRTPWGCVEGLLGNCPFPQYPTTRQNLSVEEFDALRLLGWKAADSVSRAP